MEKHLNEILRRWVESWPEDEEWLEDHFALMEEDQEIFTREIEEMRKNPPSGEELDRCLKKYSQLW